MAKITLNPIVEAVRGQVGDLVFREVNGKTVLSRKPVTSGLPTAGQIAQRERFKEAVAYGRFVMADDDSRAYYTDLALRRKTSVFALTVADYLKAPVIQSVELANYTGQPGERIQVVTSDDSGVLNVQVIISNQQGDVLDSGWAIELPQGTGRWTFMAENEIPAGTSVNVRVTAADRPGGTTVTTLSKTL